METSEYVSYSSQLTEMVSEEQTFRRLTATGTTRGNENPWTKVVVRLVELQAGLRWQFTYFDEKKAFTQNYPQPELAARIEELLSFPFSHYDLQAATADLHVRITKRGKAIVTRGNPSMQTAPLTHDRAKAHPIPADKPDKYLKAIGIMDGAGKVKPTKRDKFRQINEFIRLMHQTMGDDPARGDSLRIIDCGCGNAYLTFAGYHYLAHMQELQVRVTGIDANPDLITHCIELRDGLGWDHLDFHVSRIADFTPDFPPDMVLSLHACDTATDEAIAKGVQWGSAVILAAPCCQHELRNQLENPRYAPVMRHGILKQRTADILTDACRAQILRILGYKTDVVQFIDSQHTPKNLMIRARKTAAAGEGKSVREYLDLVSDWGIDPCLGRLLATELKPHLQSVQ